MRGITHDTLNELLDRKILYLYGFVTAVMLLIIYASGSVQGEINIQSSGNYETQAMGAFLETWVADVFSGLMTFLVFLAVMATAGLIPTMLEKGRVEFYLAKPVSRSTLLLSRVGAIWIVYGTVVLVSGAIMYGVTGMVHGIFDVRIIFLFIVYLLDLFVWLSITALAGILFNSTALVMMSAFVVWVAQKILASHEWIGYFSGSEWLTRVVDGMYYILPKTSAVGEIATQLASGRPVDSWMPLWTSVLFGVAMLGLAVSVFRRRSY